MKKLLSCAMLGSALLLAQVISAPEKVVPIAQEPSHHLALENDLVRVFNVEVAPHAETLIHKHDRDYIFVTLGDATVENDRVGSPSAKLELKDGDVKFTKGGFAHKAVNLGDTPFRNVTIELKKEQTGVTGEQFYECMGGNCIDHVFDSDQTSCKVNRANGSTSGPIGDDGPYLFVALTNLTLVHANGDEDVVVTEASGYVSWGRGKIEVKSNERFVFALCRFE
jgi:quercetin dioxygenase-like cupin family protein